MNGESMIVVDPRAFRELWPALAIWLLLFLTAGDGWTLLRRGASLEFGRPAQAVVVSKRRRSGRDYVRLKEDGLSFSEPVGGRWSRLRTGDRAPVHVLRDWIFLDDDFGYTRWKSIAFGTAFIALWAWAIARYRFG